MPPDLDLSQLSDADKDALIKALFERLGAAERRISELEAKLGEPPKTPDNSSLPPSKAQKANRRDKPRGGGPRQGSLGGEGGVLLRTFGPCIRVQRGVLSDPLAQPDASRPGPSVGSGRQNDSRVNNDGQGQQAARQP